MLTRGGTTEAASSNNDHDTPLALEFRRARFDAGSAARTLAQLCAREGVDLVTMDEAVQRVRRSAGRLHEAVAALIITHK